jgi:transposase
MSNRQIGDALGMGRTTVGDYLRRLALVGIGWPVPDELDDAALEARLFEQPTAKGDRVEPGWAMEHREMKRPRVTQQPLWEEYWATEPNGYSLSRFCEFYGACLGTLRRYARCLTEWINQGNKRIQKNRKIRIFLFKKSDS